MKWGIEHWVSEQEIVLTKYVLFGECFVVNN